MAVHVSHAALPYPIKNARYSLEVPMFSSAGVATDPTTPASSVSLDNAAWGAGAETPTVVGTGKGLVLTTYSGAETNVSALGASFSGTGVVASLATLYPRVLALIGSGTLSAGSAGGGTLGTLLAYDLTGCFIRTTGGTGGGGTGGANNQARKIITYVPSTGVFTVSPNWETTPDATTTYDVLLPEGVTLGMLKALNPTTAGDTITLTSSRVDVGKWIGTAVTLSSGVPDVNMKTITAGIIAAGSFAANALDAVWSTAARTLTAFGFTVTPTNGSISTASFVPSALDPTVFSTSAEQAFADRLLARTISGGADGGVTVFAMLAAMGMDFTVVAGVLTVKSPIDGVTVVYTRTLSRTAGLDAITGAS